MKQQTCKYIAEDGTKCLSLFHTKMYHNPKKPIKRTAIKKTLNIAKVKTSKIAKKPNKTLLKKKLEKLVKDYIKKRDDYTCQRCGVVVEGSNCHASHVIPVSRSGYLQFEPLNMKVLCYHDHINWWHKHPIEAGKWYTDKFPERWEYLEALHIKRMKPMNEYELQEKIDYYKDMLR